MHCFPHWQPVLPCLLAFCCPSPCLSKAIYYRHSRLRSSIAVYRKLLDSLFIARTHSQSTKCPCVPGTPLNVVSAETLSGELRAALQDCFLTFLQNTRQAANLVPIDADPEEDEQQEHAQQSAGSVNDVALLMLHSNCTHVWTNLQSCVLTR